MFDPVRLTDAEDAFLRYEQVRGRLPAARFPTASRTAAHLGDLADHFDAFVLDAFGVLNVGDTPIPGAVARMAELRARGKRLVVLTNAASYTRAAALRKYHGLGFDFTSDEVVSSRDVAVAHLAARAPGARWGAISAGNDGFEDIAAPVVDLIDTPAAWDACDAILFLSTARWNDDLQARLVRTLTDRPRPFVVANPDLVAPREDGLSLEPGLFAHDLADRTGLGAHWYGKPFPDAYAEVLSRLGGIEPERVAMVGDTLHTDVLGGRAAGIGTVLITDHGLFAGREIGPYIRRSGIVPDFVIPTT